VAHEHALARRRQQRRVLELQHFRDPQQRLAVGGEVIFMPLVLVCMENR